MRCFEATYAAALLTTLTALYLKGHGQTLDGLKKGKGDGMLYVLSPFGRTARLARFSGAIEHIGKNIAEITTRATWATRAFAGGATTREIEALEIDAKIKATHIKGVAASPTTMGDLGGAVGIVKLALFFVGENVVGFRYFLKLPFGSFVAGVKVRVVLTCQSPVGFFLIRNPWRSS